MSGRASRFKGMRNEYVLRDHLRDLGYEAVRVPLSGASEGFKSDVIARKDGKEYSFEMKARKDAFRKIYYVYYALKNVHENAVRYSLGQDGPFIAIGTSFEEVKTPNSHFPSLQFSYQDVFKKNVRTFTKILNLKKLLGGADYLVIRDNNRPLLFIKYW